MHTQVPNEFFGKTMKNVRERSRVELINDKATALRRSSSIFFKNFATFSENVVLIQFYTKSASAKSNICRLLYNRFKQAETVPISLRPVLTMVDERASAVYRYVQYYIFLLALLAKKHSVRVSICCCYHYFAVVACCIIAQ